MRDAHESGRGQERREQVETEREGGARAGSEKGEKDTAWGLVVVQGRCVSLVSRQVSPCQQEPAHCEGQTTVRELVLQEYTAARALNALVALLQGWRIGGRSRDGERRRSRAADFAANAANPVFANLPFERLEKRATPRGRYTCKPASTGCGWMWVQVE